MNQNNDEKTIRIEDFFAALSDYDSNMMVIEEFRNELMKRQNTFSENE
ncbi:MAG TPA: hypothetical protein VE566_03000 [Nitrososphaeraceae archaeon]|jgi:hypothetical protein|nr:hypothetical protein [Nitrososphaeraceae archaeon]